MKRKRFIKLLMGRLMLTRNEACRMDMEALERTRWIPVSERMPEHSGRCLCYCNGEVRVLKYWRTQQEFQYGGRNRNVTHWMPMPEPPEVEQNEG